MIDNHYKKINQSEVNYALVQFIHYSGSNHNGFYLYRATSEGLSLIPHKCACASIKGRSSCTIVSVGCPGKELAMLPFHS